MTYWFPRKDRNHAIALFAAASPVANIIGAPISGLILDQAWLNGLWGLRPWQWLFVIEGVPAIVLGFVTLRYLTDKPSGAAWLTTEERGWLITRQAAEEAELVGQPRLSVAQVLSSGRIWFTAAGYFTQVISFYGLVLWLPLIINAFANLGGFVGPFAVGWIKDQTGSFQIPMFVLAGCLLAYAVMMFILHGRLVREGLIPARSGSRVAQAA